ncbi:MAG: glycosyltransferase family 2 protein [Lachnospiraceae bacterium]|nr:glycosyltransferase family 2 protein [Lachnospiraceae bacterium]
MNDCILVITREEIRKAWENTDCLSFLAEAPACYTGEGFSAHLLPQGRQIYTESVLSRDEVRNVIHEEMWDEDDDYIEKLTEFYYLQFLKMQYARMAGDEFYLLWDAEYLPCSTMSFYTPDNMVYLDIREELCEDESEIWEQLIPGLHKRIELSFHTGHMPVCADYMCEMLDEIEKREYVSGKTFWEKILHIIGRKHLGEMVFQCYEMYGNYVVWRHPEKCILRVFRVFRLGADFFETNRISRSDLDWLAPDFDAISFEEGHTVRDVHKGVFENEEYRKKLTPLQMLKAVQGEYREKELIGRYFRPEYLMSSYTTDPLSEEYRIYEEIGDRKSCENEKQAWLSYQHAVFLCPEERERERIVRKKNALSTTVPGTSVVIVSYNNRELMRECVQSIRRHSGSDEYTIVAVDNASTDGVKEYLQRQKDVILHCNQENVGFPRACNQGIALAPNGEDILFLNNDTRLTHNALYWLRMGLYEADDTGAAGCISNYAGIGQMRELMLATKENYAVYAKRLNIPLEEPYMKAKILCGFAMLVKRDFLEKYGGMDEQFSPGYYEDTDLSLRIRRAGLQLRICLNSFIYHAGGMSFRKRSDLDKISERNLNYLIAKWGTDFMD